MSLTTHTQRFRCDHCSLEFQDASRFAVHLTRFCPNPAFRPAPAPGDAPPLHQLLHPPPAVGSFTLDDIKAYLADPSHASASHVASKSLADVRRCAVNSGAALQDSLEAIGDQLDRNASAIALASLTNRTKIADAAALLDAPQLEREISQHADMLGALTMIQRRDLREQKQGALAAVRATITRMNAAAELAAAAERLAHDSALESSSLGRVPFQQPQHHPFLANLVKQEQELVAQLHIIGPPDPSTELLAGEVEALIEHVRTREAKARRHVVLQQQALDYKEKKVRFFKEFVEAEGDGQKKEKSKQHPAPAASASDELLKSLLEEMRLMRTASEKTLALLAEGSEAGGGQRNTKSSVPELMAANDGRTAAAALTSQFQTRLVHHDGSSWRAAAVLPNATAANAASAAAQQQQQYQQQLSLLKLEQKLKEGSDVMDVLNRELLVLQDERQQLERSHADAAAAKSTALLLQQLDKALADLLLSRNNGAGSGEIVHPENDALRDGKTMQRNRDRTDALESKSAVNVMGAKDLQENAGVDDGNDDDDVVVELTSDDLKLPITDDSDPHWEVLYDYTRKEMAKEGEDADGQRLGVHDRIEAMLLQRHSVDRLAHEVALQGMKRQAAQQAQEANRAAFERAYNARMSLAQSIREHAHASIDWDPVQGFTFDIVCVVGLPADVTHARARISLHDGADLVSPVYTTDAAEAFYSGGMGGRTVKLGGANGEKRSFTHVIPSQGLVLVVELEVLKHDHGDAWMNEAWTALPALHPASLNLTVGSWRVPMFDHPLQKELAPEHLSRLPAMISPGLFYCMSNAAALGLGHQLDADADNVSAGMQMQRDAYVPLPYLEPPQQEQEEVQGDKIDGNNDEFHLDNSASAAAAAAAAAFAAGDHDQFGAGLKRQQGNVSAMSDFIDTNIASVSGEVGWVAPVGAYNNRQLTPFGGQETVTISIDCCRFLPHVCCCVQAYVFVVGPGATVLCSFVATSQASSASLSPNFLKGIRAQMQWPRVLTLCIMFAALDSRGTLHALASTSHPLLVDASSRRQWSNTHSLPAAGLAWLDGNVQLPLRLGLPRTMPGLSDSSSSAQSQPPQTGAPPGADFSAASFTSLPRIPCASVLIRVQVQHLPRSSDASPGASSTPVPPAPLSASSVAFLDTRALEAAIAPPPLYSDGSYDSTAATPAGSEISMYHIRRLAAHTDISVIDAIASLPSPLGRRLPSSDNDQGDDDAVADGVVGQVLQQAAIAAGWIAQGSMMNFGSMTVDYAAAACSFLRRLPLLNASILAPFDHRIGVQISVDSAANISTSSSFPVAFVCVAPPVPFFLHPQLTTSLRLVRLADANCTASCPTWSDGLKVYKGVRLSASSVVIVHIASVPLPSSGANAGLEWIGFACVPLMNCEQSYGSFQFVNSGVWQLPLYKTCLKKGLIFDDWSGKLSADLAQQMENGTICLKAMSAAEARGDIKRIPGASANIRIIDAQRGATMQLGRQDAADKAYLPTSEMKSYIPKRAGKELAVLLAKEGGVQVVYTIVNFASEISDHVP